MFCTIGNGTIEFDEFVKMMASKTTADSGVNKETFDVFDAEKCGYITVECNYTVPNLTYLIRL